MRIYDLDGKRDDQKQTLAGLKATLCALDSVIERARSYRSNAKLTSHLAQLEVIQHNIEKDIASIQKKPLRQPLSFEREER